MLMHPRSSRAAAIATLALLMAACGGGGGTVTAEAPPPAPAPSPSPAPAPASLIRFEAVYDGSQLTRALRIRPIAGAQAISTLPVASIEVESNNEVVQTLTAPNGTQSEQGQFVFLLPDHPYVYMYRGCTSQIPLRITVRDTSGFSFTKWAQYCPAGMTQFGGFSDYGDHRMDFTVASSQPVKWILQRQSGSYGDVILTPAATALQRTLASASGAAGYGGLDWTSSLPDGVTASLRISTDTGSFAESTMIRRAGDPFLATAKLLCCQPTAATTTTPVRVSFVATKPMASPDEPAFDYSYRIVDPKTGAVLRQASGTGTGSFREDVNVAGGLEMQADGTLRTPASLQVRFTRVQPVDNGSMDDLGASNTNIIGTPIRLQVACCETPIPGR